MSSVNEMMKLGNQYASNKQWESAAHEFMRALDTLYLPFIEVGGAAQPGTTIPLYEALEKKGAGPNERMVIELQMDDVKALRTELSALPDSTFPDVGDLMKRTQGIPNVGIFRFSCSLQVSLAVWTIVFYEEQTKDYPKRTLYGPPSELSVRFPTGQPYALILSRTQCRWLKPAVAAQMSYAWAHLAEAATHYTMGMYRVNQILLHESTSAIELRRQDYLRALLLNPSSHWTLAHLGESYRHAANTFTARGAVYPDADDRLKSYVTAIVYLRTAIELAIDNKEKSSWAYAHLGAAIVNTRGFLAWRKKDPPIVEHLLGDWPESWPEGPKEDEPRAAGELVDLNLAFVNRALKLLVRGQEGQGFYYPWAQFYYSGALLAKGALLRDLGIAQLGQLQVALSYYLQPQILDDIMEPGHLSVNPMFEMAAIHHCLQNHTVAWQYAWIGMKWLFKFHFQPGLYALSGCSLLVEIASEHLREKRNPVVNQVPQAQPNDSLIKAAMLLEAPSPMGLPTEPFNDREGLCQFIEESYVKCVRPHVYFWLSPGIELDSNVTVGLTTTLVIIDQFLTVLLKDHPSQSGSQDRVVFELKECKGKIESKLGVTLEPEDSDTRSHPLSLIDTNLHYYIVKRLKSTNVVGGI